MAESWNKKEKEKKKQQNKKEKAERKQERKENAGKGLDDMMAYVDENGNLSSTPPDPKKMKPVNLEDIEIGVPKQKAPDPSDLVRRGTVTFFNDAKGYGFIKDAATQESIFVHVNGLQDRISENSKVIFEVEMGPKGANAVNVKLAPAS